jgi:ubiquitin C-terminal hydrolase
VSFGILFGVLLPVAHTHTSIFQFCLVSVGGAMDDFLEAAAQKVIPLVDTGDCISLSPASPGVEADCTEIISIDEVEPQQKRIKSRVVVDISDTDSGESDLTQEELQSKQTTPYADDVQEEHSTPKMKPKIPLDKLADVYTMELVAGEDELDPENANSLYAKGTQEELKKLRKVMIIDIGSIISYVDSVLKHHGSMTTAEYINRVQRWHDAMVFSNPLRQTIRPAEDKLAFAMPPGMKNLGATCYLNTQLQCLARNTVFVEGIFSWRPQSNQPNNRIENMMGKLQQLLARMVHGAQRLISTEELSQALGLENDEMQDPNEFARLLFDRMHESFQQCSRVSKEQESLGTLLPSLFEGTMTYETTCLKCRQAKQRHEGFMDLNLPIVRRSVDSSKRTGQQKLKESFAATEDTDVQFCLDRYLCPEEMTGDNQYLCNICDCKQDATRQVVFSELPPVLNLQLCRYVFDREKHVKQKLTHGVLLNRTLEVLARDGRKSATYVLCAVMIHRGNSAYQGHYVAEAMDWQTGKWFEFNDDLVKILEKGPTCSVGKMEENDGGRKGKVTKGSKDAYNMYYVRQSFLAKSAASSIASEFWSESQPWNAKRNQISELSVLSQISSERAHLYSLLSE